MDNNETPERIALQDVMLNYAAGVDDRDFDPEPAAFFRLVDFLAMCPAPIPKTSYRSTRSMFSHINES